LAVVLLQLVFVELVEQGSLVVGEVIVEIEVAI
jgi:hypothetical protein